MLRLFYLLWLFVLVVPLLGCAGNAQRLVDESTPAGIKDKTAGSHAGNDDEPVNAGIASGSADESMLMAKAAADEQAAGKCAEVEKPAHGRASRGRQPAGEHESARQAAAASGSSSTAARSDAADPLEAEVHGMGFADPTEEASAIAALRAAPLGAPRAFLLRIMKASLESRQNSSGRGVASNGSPAADQAAGPTSGAANQAPVAPEKAAGASVRTAGPVHLASAQEAGDGSASGGQRYPDPNAVAVIEVERATELPDVVVRQTRPKAAAVRNASDETAGEWQSHVERAIAALEDELARRSGQDDRTALEARLRIMQVVANRRDDALRSRAATPAAEQEFWAKELYGLAVLLDSTRQPSATRRAGLAAEHLRQAAERLGEIGGLAVKNVHFCTEVKAYGTFVTFPQDEFRLGQEVLLYCEVENFNSKPGDRGYHTALKARYQIFDAGGNSVAEKDLGLKEEYCQNRRRDFFIPYFLSMPKQVPPGKYKLKLTVEDIHAAQSGEATIEFGIKEK